MAYNEDSSASGHDEPWIHWFCGLKGHEMFCEVERMYIEDGFNLYGLRACVSNFSDCLDLILDRIGPDDSDDSHLTQSACTLYGLIHARYIITAHGLDAMYNKYAAKEFGTCPLVQCAGQPVLPVGLKDEMGADTVKIFCPKCQCVYHPPPIRSRSSHHSAGNSGGGSGAVDGASFGTTFPHLFLMTFSNLVPDPLPPDSAYIPRVFGFRVHQSARQRSGGGGAGSAAAFSSSSQLQQANTNNRRGLAPPPAAPLGPSGAASTPAVAGVTSTGAATPAMNSKPASRIGLQSPGDGLIGKTQSSLPPQDAPLNVLNTSAGKSKAVEGACKGLNSLGSGKRGGNVTAEGGSKDGVGGENATGEICNNAPNKPDDASNEKQNAILPKRKSKGSAAGDGGKNGNAGDSNENGSLTKPKRQKRQNNGVS